MSESVSIPTVLKGKIPKTSLQFKQMIDENINLDIEPNKFIQISTYIALQMTNAMKQRDYENQQEYIDKRNKLLGKGKKWDQDSQQELTKIDSKKEEYKELLNELESKREILKSRLKEVHNKHTAFLQMERKKNKVLTQLEDSKKKLEKILVEKIEKDLETFETELKKLDEIEHVIEYEKLVKKIKVCKLKKEVIQSKIECINKTTELTDLKSLDLNECHCVFCKGYSPAQYYFGIRKDINGKTYRKEMERLKQEQNNNDNLSLSDDDDDLIGDNDDNDAIIDIKDVNSKYMNNPNQFDRKLSVIEEHEHSSEEKHDELKENIKLKNINEKPKYSEAEVVDNLMKKLTKKRTQTKKHSFKNKDKRSHSHGHTHSHSHKRGYSELDIYGKLVADLNTKRDKALGKKDKKEKKKRVIKKKPKRRRRGSTMNIKSDRDAAIKALRDEKRKKKRGNSLESNRLTGNVKRRSVKRDKVKPVIDLEAMIKGSKKKGKGKSKSRREIGRDRNKIDAEINDALDFEDRDDEKAIKASGDVKNKRVVDLKGSKKKTDRKVKNRKVKSGVPTPIRRKMHSRDSAANSNLQ